MQTIKKIISLEPFINREYPTLRTGIDSSVNVDSKGCPIQPLDISVNSFVNDNPKYGQIDKSHIVFPIQLTQTIDNIGLYTDEIFIESDVLINQEIDIYSRLTGLPLENYFTFDEYQISGYTDSHLDKVRSYNENKPFIINFNMNDEPSKGFTGILAINDDSIQYVIGGEVNNVGQYVANTGIIMETFSSLRLVVDPRTGQSKEIPLTTFRFFTKGLRNYNTSLSALIHEEKYFGIVEKPYVNSDVLVDRGQINVFERHLRLSEIDSVEQLTKYGQEFFKVVKS